MRKPRLCLDESSLSGPGQADVEDYRRVAGQVVYVAGGSIDEEDLAVRTDPIAWAEGTSAGAREKS